MGACFRIYIKYWAKEVPEGGHPPSTRVGAHPTPWQPFDAHLWLYGVFRGGNNHKQAFRKKVRRHEAECNAPRPMCQVFASYSLLLPCHCLRVMLCISCRHVHFICIHVRLMHPSIFPIVRFAIRRSYVLPLFVCGCLTF